MNNRGYAVILITAGTAAEAEQIRDSLLKARKAACVNIIHGIESAYWWQGKLESANEHMLIVKTMASKIDSVIGLVKQNHSYSVPEIIALPIIGGNPDYLEWIADEVSEELGGT
jgi:periplasmic divalent cation tolerance protein